MTGTSHQGWHYDLGEVGSNIRRGYHGFFFIWVIHLPREVEYRAADGEHHVLPLQEGQIAFFSFDTPHRGRASIESVGGVALHGYCLLHSVTETLLDFPTRLADPITCLVCLEDYFPINYFEGVTQPEPPNQLYLEPCGCTAHVSCFLGGLLENGTYCCPTHRATVQAECFLPLLTQRFKGLLATKREEKGTVYNTLQLTYNDKAIISYQTQKLQSLLRDPPKMLGLPKETMTGDSHAVAIMKAVLVEDYEMDPSDLDSPWHSPEFQMKGFNPRTVRAAAHACLQ